MDDKSCITDRIRHISNFNLSKNTTYGLGGNCKIAYFPKNENEAISIFSEVKGKKEKFFILGGGSNILASDNFYDGTVIVTTLLKHIEADGNCLTCQSGVTVAELLSFCAKKGLSGLEFLAGIPATVGGITNMNAGAGGKFISDSFINCKAYGDNLQIISNKTAKFGYKYSTMRDIDCIILSSTFKIMQSDPEKVKANIKNYLKRRLNQPKGKSCGCVFKNPDNLSAGKLIEDCGLKGFASGGAIVSEKHANFILNLSATATDVYKLIKYVKQRVFDDTGVCLEEEVVYIGEFNDTFC